MMLLYCLLLEVHLLLLHILYLHLSRLYHTVKLQLFRLLFLIQQLFLIFC